MYSLTDLILIRDRSLKRDEVQNILSIATEVIRENVIDGKDVLWVDLCTFTWKKTAKTKKEAAAFIADPSLAMDNKVRIQPAEGLEGLDASGGIIKELKPKVKKKEKAE